MLTCSKCGSEWCQPLCPQCSRVKEARGVERRVRKFYGQSPGYAVFEVVGGVERLIGNVLGTGLRDVQVLDLVTGLPPWKKGYRPWVLSLGGTF